MNVRSPQALRASLDARLQLLARERAQDINRLRRHAVFQRILRRLDESWVLKGGYLWEVRLGARARTTKDLDLSVHTDGADLAEELRHVLSSNPEGDGFIFQDSQRRAHQAGPEQLGGPGARLSITATLAGRPFAQVCVDVVSRPEEVRGGTERLIPSPVLSERGWEPVTVTAVDHVQHTAEKLPALSATNAHPRPSTRVKDLLDIVLFLDAGIVDVQRLADRLHTVFQVQDGRLPR